MSEGASRRRRRPPGRVIALGALMLLSGALCLVALLGGWLRPDSIRALVAGPGPWAMLTYILAVVLMELLWLPRMWGLLAGGLLFGPLRGALLSVVGDLAGGALCFLLARGAGQRWVSGLLEERPRARRVVELLARRQGLMTIALLRICPVAHYTLVSYAAGLAGVRPLPFLLGTGTGILPGAIIYPLAGDAALRPGSPVFFISLGLVALALVVTLFLARRLFKDQLP